MNRLDTGFFQQDVLRVAPELVGKIIVRKFSSGEIRRYRITETEAYRGEEDLACHASKGRTKRTEVMYHSGGRIYVYLIYGKYWMLNFVCDSTDFPAAVLIRGVENISGPGRVGRALQIDQSYYGEELSSSKRIWIEDDSLQVMVASSVRRGVDYAKEWTTKPWRFVRQP